MPEEKRHYEHQDLGGWIILKWFLRDRMDWIDLAQDKDRWRALVNTFINFQIPNKMLRSS
jgi:hypothetical protein